MIKVSSHSWMPDGFSSPEVVLPEEIVSKSFTRLGLRDLKGVDPMCGIGTIPRVIRSLGGICDAFDIDPYMISIASGALLDGGASCRDILSSPASGYDYVFTSPPYEWARDGLPVGLIDALRRICPDGPIFLDLVPAKNSRGSSWLVADSFRELLGAGDLGFVSRLEFITETNQISFVDTFKWV